MKSGTLQQSQRWKSRICLLLTVVVVGLLGSCSQPSHDEVIMKDIQTMLALKPELTNVDVVLLVRNGNVTLRGQVPSETARDLLEKTVRQEPGVFLIDDQTSINATANER
jgi:osmotically-inducible protein OsmY